MKLINVCLLASMLWGVGMAAPQTPAQREHERAQLRAAQREAYQKKPEVKEAKRDAEFNRDAYETRRDHAGKDDLGNGISRNAHEAKDNLHDTGRQIRDWFGW